MGEFYFKKSGNYSAVLPQSHKDTDVLMCYLIGSLNEITEKIIGCAIEVHRNSDPGLLESIYENGINRIIL
jgi:hypothetical protein